MSLIQPITLLSENLGSSFEVLVLFITVLACLIISGKDIRIGAMLFFIFSGLEFLWFKAVETTWGLNPLIALYVFFGSIIILALSLLVTTKPQGGYFL